MVVSFVVSGMQRYLTYLAVILLGGHSLVHFLGTAVYFEIVEVAELTYKTTLLGGAVDVGDAGIRVFGILWSVAAVGFLASTVAFLGDFDHWRMLLLAFTMLSLVLTLLDWTVADAGVIVNLGILAVLFFGPSA